MLKRRVLAITALCLCLCLSLFRILDRFRQNADVLDILEDDMRERKTRNTLEDEYRYVYLGGLRGGDGPIDGPIDASMLLPTCGCDANK